MNVDREAFASSLSESNMEDASGLGCTGDFVLLVRGCIVGDSSFATRYGKVKIGRIIKEGVRECGM